MKESQEQGMRWYRFFGAPVSEWERNILAAMVLFVPELSEQLRLLEAFDQPMRERGAQILSKLATLPHGWVRTICEDSLRSSGDP